MFWFWFGVSHTVSSPRRRVQRSSLAVVPVVLVDDVKDDVDHEGEKEKGKHVLSYVRDKG